MRSWVAVVSGPAILFSVAVLISLSSHPSAVEASPRADVSAEPVGKANAKTSVLERFQKSPMSFEANEGQTDERVKFISRGAGYAFFLTRDSAVMALLNARSEQPPQASATNHATRANVSMMPYLGNRARGGSRGAGSNPSEAVLNMRVVGADPMVRITATERLETTSNYFIGNDHSEWRTKVPNFGKVRYAGIYPGVDMVYYGNQRELEYDFVVAPGADPKVIALRFAGGPDGVDDLASRVDSDGDLVAHLDGGDVRFHKPVVYQSDGQQRKTPVAARYVLLSNGQVGFDVGAYDHSRTLVIDPSVSYSTYLGGSNSDAGLGVTLDRFGSCFISGSTLSADFPTLNPLQASSGGGKDIFITKFNSKATAPEYSTYVGGSGDDVATDIRLDNLGDMTVTGYTLSTNFPLQKPIQGVFGGGTVTGDAFVFQIASHGTALVYSTYFGGSSDDEGFSLAIDSSNNVFVVGYTSSTNFPTVAGSLHTSCGVDSSGVCSNGFVLKVNVPPGQNQQDTLAYSTFLGGSGGLGDAAYGIALDASDDAYVVGITGSPNFPTTSKAYHQTCGSDGKCNGTYDGFVTEMNPAGTALVFSTFLGGSGYDYSAGVALDATGIYVSGNTVSADFPITRGAAQKTFGGMSAGCVPSSSTTCGDVTVTKLKPDGSALLYSTYLGGSLDENPGMSMAIDAGGSAYVTGQTDSTNFPVANAFQSTYGGGASDAFIAKVNPMGTGFTYSSYIGGSGEDSGSRVALDAFTSAYISGTTLSTNFPVTAGVFQGKCGTDGTCNGGLSDAFAVKVSTTAGLTLTATGPATVSSGAPLTYTITNGNTGPDAASAVVTTDVVPAGSTFQSVTPLPGTCTAPVVGGTGTVTCSLGSQPKGSKFKITLVVNVTAGSGTVISNVVNTTAANGSKKSATVKTTVD